MTTPLKSKFVTVLDREIHYTECDGSAAATAGSAPPLNIVMVHGFVRTCRDFDYVARYLAEHCHARVICPDVIGRGLSQWSCDPETEYNPVFYSKVIAALLAELGILECVFFGTSMGGLIAILGIATGTLTPTIKRLILNDVGPHVNPAAMQRIMAYVVQPTVTHRVSDFVAATAESYRHFGYDLTEEQRWSLVEHCLRRLPDGTVTVHWDPAVLKGLKPPPPGTPDLWFFYDLIKCPTLVIRGEDSDVLLPETVEEMKTRGPHASVIVISRCGHAPTFMVNDDCQKLLDFVSSREAQS